MSVQPDATNAVCQYISSLLKITFSSPLQTYSYSSPLGIILIAIREETLIGLWFQDQKYVPSDLPPALTSSQVKEKSCTYTQTCHWLDLYFSGKKPDFTPTLCPDGTSFQKDVWKALLQIPYGETLTYGQLAKSLGTFPRAIGQAVSRNPISLIIPCHRVIGANEKLTGYAGGLWRKKALLELEKGPLNRNPL